MGQDVGPEIPLQGGSVSTIVVRVGDTVRRTLERWSPAAHDLLVHLEQADFEGAPRFLGIDEHGREVLSWIDGSPATRPWCHELLTDDGLVALGQLLRRFHDAVASYRPSDDAEWWIGRRPLGPGEIVCHGDLGLWNTIWQGGRPVAFIDWDFAEPGLPVADLAEFAFFATPMRDDRHCADCGFEALPDRRHRLRVLCDAYGWDDIAAVLDAAVAHWESELERMTTLGPQGIKPWDGFLLRGLLQGDSELLDWLRANRQLME